MQGGREVVAIRAHLRSQDWQRHACSGGVEKSGGNKSKLLYHGLAKEREGRCYARKGRE
jgi:hypothetical protein